MIYLTSEVKWPLQVVIRELVVSQEKAAFIGALNFITSGTAAADRVQGAQGCADHHCYRPDSPVLSSGYSATS